MQNNHYNQRPNQHKHQEHLEHLEPRGLRNELPVVDEVVAESDTYKSEDTVMLGVVADCTKLNVREEPSSDANIVCEIPKLTEVMINEGESTDDFYKICTDSGIEGFCMKKYIEICQ